MDSSGFLNDVYNVRENSFPELENKIKVLPHSCFVCSKAFVRKNTLLKHYREHSKEFGPNLEHFEEKRQLYLMKKYPNGMNDLDNSFVALPLDNSVTKSEIILPNDIPNGDHSVIQNLDSNDIIVTPVENDVVMVQSLDPSIVEHIEPQNINSDIPFSVPLIPDKEVHECNVCYLKFPSYLSLKSHAGTHHVCDCCRQIFNSDEELTEHYKMHSTERHFLCDHCHESFARRSELAKHKLKHVKNAHACSICYESFKCKISLRKHFLSHEDKGEHYCKICCETFESNKDLVMHRLKHRKKESFVCEICFSSFFKESALKMHYLSHPKERPFVCDVCNDSFTIEDDLVSHRMSHNASNKSQSVCKICGKTFDKKSDLHKHKAKVHSKAKNDQWEISPPTNSEKARIKNESNNHTIKRLYVCNVCNNAFREKDEFEAHKESHETITCEVCDGSLLPSDYEDHMLMHNEGRMFTCRICTMSFMFKEDLASHTLSAHSEGKPFHCNICSEGFEFKSDLREHKQVHNEKKLKSDVRESRQTRSEKKLSRKSLNGSAKLKNEVVLTSKQSSTRQKRHSRVEHICITCCESFPTKKALVEHEIIHDDDMVVEYESCFICKYCRGEYSSKSDLTDHMSSCNEKKVHNCRACSMKFKTKDDLLNHKAFCAERKSHLCKNCNERFKTKEDLLEHKKVHSRRQPFLCKVCNEGFKNKEDLEVHKKIHNTSPTYPCNICDKIFLQKDNLREHKLCHEGEITYICSVCEATFENKVDFKAHRETHDFIIHQCKVCNETFNMRKDLKRHYLKHILERPNLCRICNANFVQWGALRSHYLNHTRN
ncbi:zinc finger protein 493 [Parasteatoda tepidariorum]|uniref:zinc finger protein 493 n=1 Tax=Parasteatoda tepidariorum TaxID=114398 RepID=UPI00077F9874|nr:zinc finger protein 271 [Parasteatoda tepidariorum]XP_015920152.1 zinc finger protein 271 [Parasteatoda tepidariorum]